MRTLAAALARDTQMLALGGTPPRWLVTESPCCFESAKAGRLAPWPLPALPVFFSVINGGIANFIPRGESHFGLIMLGLLVVRRQRRD